jgi:hypothetical protein
MDVVVVCLKEGSLCVRILGHTTAAGTLYVVTQRNTNGWVKLLHLSWYASLYLY